MSVQQRGAGKQPFKEPRWRTWAGRKVLKVRREKGGNQKLRPLSELKRKHARRRLKIAGERIGEPEEQGQLLIVRKNRSLRGPEDVPPCSTDVSGKPLHLGGKG